MSIHPKYVEAQGRLEVCRRCDEFYLRPSAIGEMAVCYCDSEPWSGHTPLRDWNTGHVPKSCSRLAEYDPAEALRQLCSSESSIKIYKN